ncbi:MAG TPA: multiheme c-type cytochrome [Terracidiphilus sp.]|jgi:hypothetical protein
MSLYAEIVMTRPGRLLWGGLLLLFMISVLTWGQAGPRQVNPCARCHAEGSSQPATNMAHALESVETASVLIDNPLLTATYGRFSYRIERQGDQSIYSVSDGVTTETMPIRWAMGASSAMGQTYILEKNGELYESRMSWFKELKGIGPTLGGSNSLPTSLHDAAGRLMSRDDKLRCFGCHATNAAIRKELTLERMTPGVQCGHCHEAIEEHLTAMARGSGKPAVPVALSKLQGLSAEQASNFCGRCHRTWAEIALQGNPGIGNIRFQPYRLTGSKCYDPDDARISCVACHNPHREASEQPVNYDAKCQACHGGGKVAARACPVSRTKCVTCHMPRIELPGGHYKFSDHRIRIVKPGEPYPG